MTGVIAAVLIVLGGAFMLLAAVGVVRMPDVFLRLQATSKATTLGVGCLMLGAAFHFGDLGTALRATIIIALCCPRGYGSFNRKNQPNFSLYSPKNRGSLSRSTAARNLVAAVSSPSSRARTARIPSAWLCGRRSAAARCC